nr:immunoglobulin light chain junction region [Macaca mulatta]MOV37005.1 immunoglobulin light chain junction region [Macaca mulatta]MOV37050.1 immunoglobulin light chain junction region [Macaca mulatta]MOV37077.1 immunoglobulin light chain junction region [Macaca mulatta]MOV37102.1 immunoglobulin light chain junction region [Macaca mulatta]
CYQHSSGYTF